MKKKVMKGMPYAGNPHVRVVEGKVESAAKPRRWSLLYKRWINRHKRMELARRLLAERGYNSTNRPSSKVLGEILADAGTIRPKRAIWTSNHATPIAPMDNVTTDAGRNTSKDDGSSHARAYPKAASGSRQYVRIRGVGGLIAHMLPESAKPEVSASLLVELPLLLLGGVLLIAVLAFVIGFVARRLRSRNPWHGYGRDDYYECDDNDDEE